MKNYSKHDNTNTNSSSAYRSGSSYSGSANGALNGRVAGGVAGGIGMGDDYEDGYESIYLFGRLFGLTAALFAIFIAVSLFTYHADDSCINVATGAKIRNLGGYYGAIVSDLMLQALGFAAYITPILFIVWAGLLLLKGSIKFMWIRIPCWLIASASMATMCGFFVQYNFTKQMLPGGAMGFYLSSKSLLFVPMPFTFFVCICLMLTCFYFAVGVGVNARWYANVIGASILFVALKLWSALCILFRIVTLQPVVDVIKSPDRGVVIKEMLNMGGRAADGAAKMMASAATDANRKKLADYFDDRVGGSESDGYLAIRDDGAGRMKLGDDSSVGRVIDGDAIGRNAERRRRSGSQDDFEAEIIMESYKAPSAQLLAKVDLESVYVDKDEMNTRTEKLMKTIADFGVKGRAIGYMIGPVVTLYEIQPQAGVKASRVIGLASDIARTMQVMSARVSVVPGKDAIGVELPNKKRQPVMFRQLIESAGYTKSKAALPIILGKSLTGDPVVADLATMPHLLIAGTTGSGKSVGVNAMILSILYKMSPKMCKFIMIDPKMLEFSMYDGIPHLLTPVITDPNRAILALKWVVGEMERRYKLMSGLGVRNIGGYNEKASVAKSRGGKIIREVEIGYNKETKEVITERIVVDAEMMPFIVVIIDEMADLMVVAGKEIEVLVQRLAQMARAAGIHLIMATQRPSVDIITGVIKANFPTRISYQVTSKFDSRTILGEQGAEQLLGQGDMLYMSLGSKITRVHGPFVSDNEVETVANYLKSQYSPEYVDIVADAMNAAESALNGGSSGGMGMRGSADAFDINATANITQNGDSFYNEAVKIVTTENKTSISYVQRKLRIGYNRAANLIEQMEQEGVLSAPDNLGRRRVIKSDSDED